MHPHVQIGMHMIMLVWASWMEKWTQDTLSVWGADFIGWMQTKFPGWEVEEFHAR